MHEKERLLLLTLPFFFILLFGCNQRDIVVNITPVSSAINSAYISSGDEQSRVISDKIGSEKRVLLPAPNPYRSQMQALIIHPTTKLRRKRNWIA